MFDLRLLWCLSMFLLLLKMGNMERVVFQNSALIRLEILTCVRFVLRANSRQGKQSEV